MKKATTPQVRISMRDPMVKKSTAIFLKKKLLLCSRKNRFFFFLSSHRALHEHDITPVEHLIPSCVDPDKASRAALAAAVVLRSDDALSPFFRLLFRVQTL